MDKITIYHGSTKIIENPKYGVGKPYNDYGLGFYCTKNIELAKEWACTSENNGFANKYILDTRDLLVFHLSEMNILNWLAVLVSNRTFKIKGPLAIESKEYLEKEFLPDIKRYDVIYGYRADDSYFSFAESFLNGGISLEQLSRAMKLGNLGEQVVIKSKKAFDLMEYKGYEIASKEIYFTQRETRDIQARNEYREISKSIKASESVYMLDILREGWTDNDERL